MKIVAPPWIAGEEFENPPIDRWTVEGRHRWMVESLAKRRREVLDESRPPSPYAGFCRGVFSEAASEYEEIVEIVSDDLGVDEPIWDGLWSMRGFEPLPLTEQRSYREKIKQRRSRVTESLDFPTHLSIGQRLYDSVLFLVCRTNRSIEVRYQHGDEWISPTDVHRPLPIILFDAEPTMADREKKIRTEIEKTLRVLSRDVIWPVLWPEQRGLRTGWSFVSLVLVKASLWQVPGVWALHVAYSSNEAQIPDRAPSTVLHTLVQQPSSCIQDVLGALFRHHHPQAHQERDVNLLRCCKGGRLVNINPSAGLNLSEDEKPIYDRGLVLDPVKRFGGIFTAARRFWTVKKKLPSSSPGRFCQRVLEAIQSAFIAWQVPEFDFIPRLLIESGMRSCLTLVSPSDCDDLRQRYERLYAKCEPLILATVAPLGRAPKLLAPDDSTVGEVPTIDRALSKVELMRFFLWVMERAAPGATSAEQWLMHNDLRILLLSQDFPQELRQPLTATTFQSAAIEECLAYWERGLMPDAH